MPPKEWSDLELQIAGALNTGKARKPDLTGPLHPLFKPERWRYYNKLDHDLLLPSMHLASNLLEVGLPYIANFLPSEQYEKVKNGPYDEIDLQEDGNIRKAGEFLEALAENVTWELNADMFHTMNAWGMNILTDQRQPWHHETWEEIIEHDRQAQQEENASPLRRITIGIASQYIEYLSGTRDDSEQHIRAIWHAAITMVHEIGHFIWNCRFTNIALPDGEPYVGDMCVAELGTAFISWMFSGHTPNTIATDKLSNPFLRPLIWRKEKTLGDLAKLGPGNRPHYVTYWSMTSKYLEDMLSQKFWSDLGGVREGNFAQKAKLKIRPGMITGKPKPATAFIRDWEFVQNLPVWRIEGRDRTPRPDTLRATLTKAEKQLARLEMKEEEEAKMENMVAAGIEDPQWMRNRARINDGVIIPDIDVTLYKEDTTYEGEVRAYHDPEKPPQIQQTETIEVRFWSLPENHLSGLSDKSTIYNAYERWKYGLDAPLDGHSLEDVKAVIDTTTHRNILNRFTRAQALEFVKIRRLGAFQIPPEKWLQDQKLSYEKDSTTLSRIECFLLVKLVRHYEKLPSLTIDEKIVSSWCCGRIVKIAQSKVLAYWNVKSMYARIPEDIRNENPYEEGEDEKAHMENTIRYWYQNKASVYNETLKMRLGSKERVENALWALSMGTNTDPNRSSPEWSVQDLREYLTRNKLPIWGDYATWVERYYAWEYETKYGYPRYRPLLKDLRDRWRSPGEEMYVFQVDPRQTSVSAFKSALYTTGHFPADCNLILRNFNGSPRPLKDSDPLSVALEERDGVLNKILICEVDEPVPRYIMDQKLKEHTQPTLWNRPQVLHRLAANQRKEELVHARYNSEQIPPLNTKLTLQERYAHIQTSAALLEQAMQPDNGNLKAQTGSAMAASALLEQMEDYEDLLEKRLRGGKSTRGELLDMLAEEEDRKKRKSHMRDFVSGLKRRNIGLGTRSRLGNWEKDVLAPYKPKRDKRAYSPSKGYAAAASRAAASVSRPRASSEKVYVVPSGADTDTDEPNVVELDPDDEMMTADENMESGEPMSEGEEDEEEEEEVSSTEYQSL
ncbi:hypothetical protein HYFRA_00001193 [Hymenoscyphus fraxineus]|uniref:Uncharacterized protein n=1 Tax=Hymenoscyphus fraxineus TaxID=746836 RepID=A0A9N9PMK1_9HELO|nr:hypothetical protein HYFRA_00001193 [Hymenoscyphus fraxineus]